MILRQMLIRRDLKQVEEWINLGDDTVEYYRQQYLKELLEEQLKEFDRNAAPSKTSSRYKIRLA